MNKIKPENKEKVPSCSSPHPFSASWGKFLPDHYLSRNWTCQHPYLSILFLKVIFLSETHSERVCPLTIYLRLDCFVIYHTSARSTRNAWEIHTLFMFRLQIPVKTPCFNSIESLHLISCLFTVLYITFTVLSIKEQILTLPDAGQTLIAPVISCGLCASNAVF